MHIIHAEHDAEHAAEVRDLIEAGGSSVWRDPHGWTPGTYNHDRALDQAILGSDLVVLLWSGPASKSRTVSRQLQLTGRLAKPIITLYIDSCPVPGPARNIAAFPLGASQRRLPECLRDFKPDGVVQAVVRQLADERVAVRQQGLETLRRLAHGTVHHGQALTLLAYLIDCELDLSLRSLAESALIAALGSTVTSQHPGASSN